MEKGQGAWGKQVCQFLSVLLKISTIWTEDIKTRLIKQRFRGKKKKKIQGGIGAGGDPRKVNKKFALKCEREK